MILHLLDQNYQTMETESEQLLSGYSTKEKAAYLGVLASLATADRHADEEELEHFRDLAATAGVSGSETETILQAANDTSGNHLLDCLDTIKNSDLRFSLVTDLIALAKTDEDFTPAEKSNIEKVSKYLGVNKDQFTILDQFVDKVADNRDDEQEITKPGFTKSVDMQNQFAGAGMNMSSIGSGLLRFLGPMILGGMAARSLGGRSRTSSGGLGGMLGNNPMGMGRRGGFGGLGGGLGSIISGMARGRSNQSLGGMLGRLLK